MMQYRVGDNYLVKGSIWVLDPRQTVFAKVGMDY